MKHKSYFVIIGILGLLTISFTIIQAATYIYNQTTNDIPACQNPGWQFWVESDTVIGDAICIQVHPVGDAGNYIQTECAYDTSGTAPANWRCDVFTSGVPTAFRNTTVEYQFHTANYDTSCQENTYYWRAFLWTFTTGPTAVSLQSFAAKNNTIPVLLITTVLVLLLGVTAFIWQHKRR